mgnify:FL=1
MVFLIQKTSATVIYSLTIFPIDRCSCSYCYTLVVQSESPESDNVALVELDVVFNYIDVNVIQSEGLI